MNASPSSADRRARSSSTAAARASGLTLNLSAGHYALICNIDGHYRAGTHADFTVR